MTDVKSVANGVEPAIPNADRQVTVKSSDLPLHCPIKGTSLWNSHPRVYIPIGDSPTGKASCPYCGTEYVLRK